MTHSTTQKCQATITTALILDAWHQVHHKSIDPNGETIILWNDFSPLPEDKLIISLPSYIEANSERLRSKFVLFIDSIADFVPPKSGKSIAQLLSLEDGFSLWWMNILSEKSNYSKSPWITDAVKLIALLEIVSSDPFKIETFDLRLENIDLVLILQGLAASRNIRLLSAYSRAHLFLHRILRVVGSIGIQFRLMLRASAWFIIYIKYANYILNNTRTFHDSRQPSITIFSYLCRRQDFVSLETPVDPYWRSLPELIHSRNHAINWIYLYSADKTLPSLQSATECISFLNSQADTLDRHTLLESFATPRTFLKAYKTWIMLCFRVNRALSSHAPQSRSLGFNTSALISRDWQASIFGSTGLKNIIYVYLFEAYFSTLPRQDYSLYLQENMDWEYAFIRAARLYESSYIIGFPHTIIRFWDLRYFFVDNKSIVRNGLSAIRSRPQPDIVALCSEVSFNLLRAGDCYLAQLACVEAVRYQHLKPIHQNSFQLTKHKPITILMVGQYDLVSTNRSLQILNECLQLSLLSSLKFRILFKAHPSTPVDLSRYTSLDISLWEGSLESAAQIAQISISPLQTAASLDIYMLGLPVIIIDDANSLNLCPLREFSSYKKAAIPAELAARLLEIVNSSSTDFRISREEPYLLSPSLEGWSVLFDQAKNKS